MIIEQQLHDADLLKALSTGCLHLGVSTPETASGVRDALNEGGFHFLEIYDRFNGDWDFQVFSSEEAKKAKEESTKGT